VSKKWTKLSGHILTTNHISLQSYCERQNVQQSVNHNYA